MSLIHHVVTGAGLPPIVFVHGFGCAHADWDQQVAHLSPRYRTVAVDLRGHGASPGTASACSIERYGADVAEVMAALDVPQAILIGHSMGCRVVVEAALQAPERTAGVILVDGSQFAAAMGPVLKARFAATDGYATLVGALFKDMFFAKSDQSMAASIIERARRLPGSIGEKLLIDLQRYDVHRLTASLSSLSIPVMALQSTDSNEKRERTSLREGQTSRYLDMLRAAVPAIRIEIVENTGHFPQLEEAGTTNARLDDFLANLASHRPA